tara:strand:- start:57 stop:1067 length:1011 start_codon:yes stop_codon:yes gene_type:complete
VSTVSPKTHKLLALKSIKGVGPATVKDICGFLELSVSEMLAIIGSKYSMIDSNTYKKGERFAENQVAMAQKLGHSIVSILDTEYPKNLKATPNPPPILYVQGNLKALNEKSLTIIGTREPTEHGRIIAARVTKWACQHSWNVVSGLALGVDTIAHENCIKSEGTTIAVLAHGLDSLYPRTNSHLAEQIVEANGSLVTEYPYGTTVRPAQFVQRDKVQAALSAGVLLIQSGENGGSLHASRAALYYGRPLAVMGQSKTDIRNAAPKSLANTILLTRSEAEVCRILQINTLPKDLLVKVHSRKEYSTLLQAINKSQDKLNSCNSQFPSDELNFSNSPT